METKVISNDVMFAEVKKFISEGSSVEIRVKGNSMNPFLASGRDTIVLSPVIMEDLVPGAFVLGRDSFGRWVAHRIVKVAEDYVILNGDGNFIKATERVEKSDILAQVTGFVRKGRRCSTDGFSWKAYSAYWKVAGALHIGSWSLRRVHLGIWRRLNSSYILKPTANK